MKAIIVIALMLGTIDQVHAMDDVYLKSRKVFRNVEVTEYKQSGDRVVFRMFDNKVKMFMFYRDSVEAVTLRSVDFSTHSFVERWRNLPTDVVENRLQFHTQTERRYWFLLPASLSFLAAWRWIDVASATTNLIDAVNQLNALTYPYRTDTSLLENERTRSYISAGIATIAGVVFAALAFKPIEVQQSRNGMTISYAF